MLSIFGVVRAQFLSEYERVPFLRCLCLECFASIKPVCLATAATVV